LRWVTSQLLPSLTKLSLRPAAGGHGAQAPVPASFESFFASHISTSWLSSVFSFCRRDIVKRVLTLAPKYPSLVLLFVHARAIVNLHAAPPSVLPGRLVPPPPVSCCPVRVSHRQQSGQTAHRKADHGGVHEHDRRPLALLGLVAAPTAQIKTTTGTEAGAAATERTARDKDHVPRPRPQPATSIPLSRVAGVRLRQQRRGRPAAPGPLPCARPSPAGDLRQPLREAGRLPRRGAGALQGRVWAAARRRRQA